MILIRLRKEQITKIPYPYSNCISKNDINSFFYKFVQENLPRYEYTQQLCLLLVFQKRVSEQCKCYATDVLNIYEGVPPCKKNEDMNCLYEEYYSYLNEDIWEKYSDDCPLGNEL